MDDEQTPKIPTRRGRRGSRGRSWAESRDPGLAPDDPRLAPLLEKAAGDPERQQRIIAAMGPELGHSGGGLPEDHEPLPDFADPDAVDEWLNAPLTPPPPSPIVDKALAADPALRRHVEENPGARAVLDSRPFGSGNEVLGSCTACGAPIRWRQVEHLPDPPPHADWGMRVKVRCSGSCQAEYRFWAGDLATWLDLQGRVPGGPGRLVFGEDVGVRYGG